MTSTAHTFTLRANAAQAQDALRTGWLAETRVVARRLIASSDTDSDPEILFERLDPLSKQPPGILPWLQTLRAFSLTATASPCLAVLFLFLFRHQSLNHLHAITALLGVLCLQISVNVFNDVQDYRRLIDLPGTLGGSGAIQEGWWTPRSLNRGAWVALGFGALLGLPAVLSEPRSLLPVAALGTLGSVLYSAKRLGLKYIALGDGAVFLLCGPALTLGYALAISRSSNAGVIWLGAYFGLLAMAILHVNNVQDMKLDRQRGIETLAIRLGFRGSLRLLVAIYIGAVVTLVAATASGDLPKSVLAGIIPIGAIALPWLRSILGAIGPESSLLAQCRIKAAQIHLASGSALIFGLALGIALEKFGL